MADIFDEVSEDLRQDQIIKFWKKYSKIIISFVTLIVILVFGYQGYNSWAKNQLNTKSEYFFNALEQLEDKKFKETVGQESSKRTSKSKNAVEEELYWQFS